MDFIGIIPARYNSSRFPGKVLCNICGKTMIEWVFESVSKWNKWRHIYVATDNDIVAKKCSEKSIPYIMTSENHVDCLDRVFEAAKKLKKDGIVADRYITIQGDEPLFNVKSLDIDLTPQIVNLYTETQYDKELFDSNCVKVVFNNNLQALYFSRYGIPYFNKKVSRLDKKFTIYKQIGVYSFSLDMLQLYHFLPVSDLEASEGIGLNRLLENGIDVFMRYTPFDSVSVDTESDRQRIVNIVKEKYSNMNMSIDDNGNVIDSDGFVKN